MLPFRTTILWKLHKLYPLCIQLISPFGASCDCWTSETNFLSIHRLVVERKLFVTVGKFSHYDRARSYSLNTRGSWLGSTAPQLYSNCYSERSEDKNNRHSNNLFSGLALRALISMLPMFSSLHDDSRSLPEFRVPQQSGFHYHDLHLPSFSLNGRKFMLNCFGFFLDHRRWAKMFATAEGSEKPAKIDKNLVQVRNSSEIARSCWQIFTTWRSSVAQICSKQLRVLRKQKSSLPLCANCLEKVLFVTLKNEITNESNEVRWIVLCSFEGCRKHRSPKSNLWPGLQMPAFIYTGTESSLN